MNIKNLIICLFASIFFCSASYAVVLSGDVTLDADVKCAGNKWSVKCLPGQEYVPPGVIFSDDFDSYPDWNTAGNTDCSRETNKEACQIAAGQVPEKWTHYRAIDERNPSTGYPSNEYAMRITSEQGMGGVGKALISSKESSKPQGEANYYSDAILMKELGADYDELWVSFYVMFPVGFEWVGAGNAEAKMFRMGHIDDGPNIDVWQLGGAGGTAPMYLFQAKESQVWGWRGHHEPRCDDQAVNYYCDNHIGYDPLMKCPEGVTCNESVNGDTVSYNAPTFAQIMTPGEWVKFEFHMKLNDVGVANGEFTFWVNNVEQVHEVNEQYRYAGSVDADTKINFFSIGGNWNNFIGPIWTHEEQEYFIDNVRACDQRCPL